MVVPQHSKALRNRDVTQTATSQVVRSLVHEGENSTDNCSDTDDLSQIVATNLKLLRRRRGLSLERLATVCGVSRAMLSQIELARSVPTIKVVWKIAKALDVPFSALIAATSAAGLCLIRKDAARTIPTASASTRVRALFPPKSPRRFEFYEWTLSAGASEPVHSHESGTVESIVVSRGILELTSGDDLVRLSPGDSVTFSADSTQVFKNGGTDVLQMYVVVVFAEPVF